jgi:hypothetical protein
MPVMRHSIGPFRGLNQDENPAQIEQNELIEAINTYHSGRRFGTRPGMIREPTGSEYAEITKSKKPIQGIFEHLENFGTGRHLIAVAERTVADGGAANIYYEDEAVLPVDAQITHGASAANNIWTFASHNNKTYGAGGLVNGVNGDDFWMWDGVVATGAADIAIVDSAGARIRPQYVYAWRNYLLINGLAGGVLADNNPSTTRFCEFGTDPTVITNWKAKNTIGYNAFGKSYTTGLASYRDNQSDVLLILYNDSIAAVALTGGYPEFHVVDAVANGCVHQRAFVELGADAGDAIYMSEKGIHSLRQSQEHGNRTDEFLSHKIRVFFNTINQSRIKYAVGAYDFTRGIVVFAVSVGSETINDTLICLDMKDQEQVTAQNAKWSIWKTSTQISGIKIGINELKMAQDEGGTWRLYFGTNGGNVGYFSDDVFSDFGLAYTVQFQTRHEDFGSIQTTKTLGDISMVVGPGGDYTPAMRFHFDHDERVSRVRQITMPEPPAGAIVGTAVVGPIDIGNPLYDTLKPVEGVVGSDSDYRTEKIYGVGSGRTVGFSFSHWKGNEPFWVSKVDYDVDIAGEDIGSV